MIDSHRHFMFGKADEQALLREMDRDGIRRTVLFGYQGLALLETPHAQDDAILGIAGRNPQRIIPFFCDVDFYRDDALDYVRRCVPLFGGLGEVLIGHTPIHRLSYPDRRLDDRAALDIFREVGRHGLPVLFHADPPFETQADAMLAACPDTQFIWAHCAYDFVSEYGGAPRSADWAYEKLTQYRNLTFDLSHWIVSPTYLMRPQWQSLLAVMHRRFVLGLDMSEDYETEGLWLHVLRAALDRLPDEAAQNIGSHNLCALLPQPWKGM